MDPFEIDDNARYQVLLTRPVMRGIVKLLPRDRHTIAGAVLREIVAREGWDAIGAAVAL